jgi:putative protease
LNEDSRYSASSIGHIHFGFGPNPEKSFNRGFTNYFIDGRKKNQLNAGTEKSIGEPIGAVVSKSAKSFYIETSKEIIAGDGLCFFDDQGVLQGFRINRAENNQVFPSEIPVLKVGTMLYRNNDVAFEKLSNQKGCQRKRQVELLLAETSSGFSLCAKDITGIEATVSIDVGKQLANKPDEAFETMQRQLKKAGDTIFEVKSVNLNLSNSWFLPISAINQIRRDALQKLEEKITEQYQPERIQLALTDHPFPKQSLNYTANIANHLAEKFYKRHGVTSMSRAFEIDPIDNVPLMTTRHCLFYELSMCPKETGKPTEELLMTNRGRKIKLKADCKNCQMLVTVQV